MDKKIFYRWRTIIFFIIIALVFLWVSFSMGKLGGGSNGIPFKFYSYGTGHPPDIPPYSNFNLINFILDLVIYYVLAVLISFGISKFKK